MADNISQLFKVHWLSTTLKFIKNDSQNVLQYPKMPANHVEYLRSVWQHQDNIESDFESAWASLKAAIRASSLKYQFKLSVSKSGDMRQLKIEKIPKSTAEDSSGSDEQNEEERVPENTSDNGKERSKNPPIPKAKPKQQTKSQKYFIMTRKLIESVSPAFIKSSFQKILDFISDVPSASMTFTDLAPNGATFLQNFLGIYNRREVFSPLFSPSCNDILDKMFVMFKEFDKNAKLEICVVKTDEKTRKREITFLKVPRYTNDTTPKLKLRKNVEERSDNCSNNEAVKTNNGAVKTNNEALKTNNEALKTNNKVAKTNNEAVKTNNEVVKTNNGAVNPNNEALKTINEALKTNNKAVKTNNKVAKTNNEAVKTNNEVVKTNNGAVKTNNGAVKTNNKVAKTNNEAVKTNNEVVKTNNGAVKTNNGAVKTSNKFLPAEVVSRKDKENFAMNDVKSVTEQKKSNVKEKKLITVSIDNSKVDPEPINKSTNKKVTLINTQIDNKYDLNSNLSTVSQKTDNIKTIDKAIKKNKSDSGTKLDKKDFLKDTNKNSPQLTKKSISFEKPTGSIDNEDILDKDKNKGNCTRKVKLLEAMSTPLESDKALRMMQLMGWEGGALGLRGEGITEPIIPDLNRKSLAGLGHVSGKSTKKQDKQVIRLEFLENILHLIDKYLPISIISYNNELSKKEKRYFNEVIDMFNKKRNCLGKEYGEIGEKILDKMANKLVLLDISLSKCSRHLTLRNLKLIENNTENINNEVSVIKKTKKSKKVVCMAEYKTLVLTKVLELLKSENDSVIVSLDEVLTKRQRRFAQKVCLCLNMRCSLPLTKGMLVPYVTELFQNIRDYLVLEFGADLRFFTVSKVKENPEIKNTQKKTNNDEKLPNKIYEQNQSVTKINNNLNNSHNVEKLDKNNNNKDLLKTDKVANKTKSYIILIEPLDETDRKQFVKTVTDLITTKIEREIDFLPYLKSHGIQNGYLVYSCFNKKSCLWLKFVLCQYRVIDYRGIDNKYVLQIKTNAHMDVNKVLYLLDKYNNGLNSTKWQILERSNLKPSLEFLVTMELDSFELIRDNNFRLNAGVDEVEFNISHYIQS